MGIQDQISQLKKTFGENGVLSESVSLREMGDKLRDGQNFSQAAEAYGKYLKLRPDDFKIWVQYGNCLKDAGKLASARLAYESAVALNRDDADVHLQMGHLLKLQGRVQEAAKHYRTSHELDPVSGLAARELYNLGIKPRVAGSPLESVDLADKSAKILDISDLLAFLDVHNRVTGIQRVQSCIIQELLVDADNSGWTSSVAGSEIILAYCDQPNQIIYAVSTTTINRLLTLVQLQDPTQDEVIECLACVRASRIRISPRSGDIYVILGAFWIGNDYSGALVSLKNSGVRIGVYIYDLIPLTHPQFVTESTLQDVSEKFGDVMSLADFVLTISDYVAKDVSSIFRNELNRTPPVYSVPLSHALPDSFTADAEPDTDFISSLPKDYVLCVSTLEGRKNHALLLNVWSSLNRKYEGNIPHLILVGKWGWRIEEFRSQLESQRNLDGKIVVMGNLPDSQLKLLYQNCLFTVFPSFVEGWGLPVGESLALGKPCIASNTSSIPEVGGSFCRYINPHDPLSAMVEIERVLNDREDLRQWTADVAKNFKVRTWADVAENFLRKVDSAARCDAEESNRVAVTFEAGRVYRFGRAEGDTRAKATWASRAAKFACSAGWWPAEDWGAWSFRRSAKIQFGTRLSAGSKVRLLLNLRLPPPTDRGALTIRDWNNSSKEVFFSDGLPKWVQMEAETGEFGVVSIQLERFGEVKQIDPNRELYSGISSIGYYAKDDLASRMDIMESIVLFDDR